jgi:hypothetical protein
MKSVPNLISYLQDFFWNFSQFLAIYFERFSSGVILIQKTLTSGSHLSDAVVRAGPAWQHAIATWLPRTAPHPCIKCSIGTTRRHPDSTAPFRPAPFRPRCRRCPNSLTSPRPVPTAPSPLSEATPPPCPNPVAVRPSSAVASFVHGEHRQSLPLAVSLPWSVELTFSSLLTIAGLPSATVAPPRWKKRCHRAGFLPLTVDEELR